jgi:hypothetical protein
MILLYLDNLNNFSCMYFILCIFDLKIVNSVITEFDKYAERKKETVTPLFGHKIQIIALKF